MQAMRVKYILTEKPMNKKITVHGWIRTTRDSKSFSFIELNDGSVITNLQIFIDKSSPELVKLLPDLTTGASIQACGTLKASPGGKQDVELHAEQIAILGKAPAEEYPLQKKRHSFEYLR